jgi:competence ComEA-like helix-hairpin-helix protein
VIHDAVVAAHYQREFERLYTNAILGIPPAIKKKAAAQAKECAIVTAIATSPSPKKPLPSTSPPAIKSAQSSTSSATKPKTAQAAKRSGAAPSQPTQRVNLNLASQAELETLPGIGPGLAKRIIAARQQKQFTSLADVDRVSGVGPKLLEKLKNKISW